VRVGRPNRGYKRSSACRPPNSLTTQAPTPPLRRPPPSNFVLVEVLLPHAKPAAEKEAFWAEFRAGVEARLPSIEPDIALRFVEMLGEKRLLQAQGATALMAPPGNCSCFL
jgi:hypothetical protein